MPTLIAVAHGTRSPAGQAQIRDLAARVAARRPGLDVRLTYVDVQEPKIADVVPLIPGAVVVPLLLSAGYHVRVDIADAVAGRPIPVSRPLGPDDVLRDSLLRHLPPADAVVLAAAGSSDPAWRADVETLAADLTDALSSPRSAVRHRLPLPPGAERRGNATPFEPREAELSTGARADSVSVDRANSGPDAWYDEGARFGGGAAGARRAGGDAVGAPVGGRGAVDEQGSSGRHGDAGGVGVAVRDGWARAGAGQAESRPGADRTTAGDAGLWVGAGNAGPSADETTGRHLGVHAGYVSGPGPRVADVVAELRDRGARRIAIAAYLLADGLFYRTLSKAGADHVTPPLGLDPAVTGLVLQRFDEALTTAAGRL